VVDHVAPAGSRGLAGGGTRMGLAKRRGGCPAPRNAAPAITGTGGASTGARLAVEISVAQWACVDRVRPVIVKATLPILWKQRVL
jgi:hypothetical protein